MGKSERLRELSTKLPGLSEENCSIESARDGDYNCVAWALGKDDEWWEPGMFWPEGASSGSTVVDFASVFLQRGFEFTRDRGHEKGVQKVAIYGTEFGVFEHVARQLPDGRWTSKLGPQEDVEHDTLEVLEGGEYSNVMAILKRPASSNEPEQPS